jgi:shikimate kinase
MAAIIYLVGFMGSGKSSVGRRLAELLGWEFVDLDDEIERREGRPIREIFACLGEPHFRAVEREELARVSRMSRRVVALGGGAFCNQENASIVEKTGTSVWLDAPLDRLVERCSGSDLRPLFTSLPEAALLLDRRRPFYARAAVRIDVGELSIEEAASEILARVRPETGSPTA